MERMEFDQIRVGSVLESYNGTYDYLVIRKTVDEMVIFYFDKKFQVGRTFRCKHNLSASVVKV